MVEHLPRTHDPWFHKKKKGNVYKSEFLEALPYVPTLEMV